MQHNIVINTQIVSEIDIRTLTSQQVLGQILDHIYDQIFDQVLGQILDQIFDQVLDQVFWTRKDSVQFYWDRKGYTLTTSVFSGPTQKTGYPLSTNDIAKHYLFVNDYIQKLSFFGGVYFLFLGTPTGDVFRSPGSRTHFFYRYKSIKPYTAKKENKKIQQ